MRHTESAPSARWSACRCSQGHQLPKADCSHLDCQAATALFLCPAAESTFGQLTTARHTMLQRTLERGLAEGDLGAVLPSFSRDLILHMALYGWANQSTYFVGT